MEKEADNPEIILGKINRTLDELLKFKNVLMVSLENTTERMDKIEVKLQDTKPDLNVKATEIQIEKIEKEIEKLNQEQAKATKLLKGIEKLENNMEEISKFTKELDKKWSDDNKFQEGVYMEIKSHIEETNQTLRENSKEMKKLENEITKVSGFKTAFQNLIKSVME
jgi:paraquat-inducible protein B